MSCAARLAVLMLVLAPASPTKAQSVVASQVEPPDSARAWTLEEAVSAALAQHPLIEAARARVDAARGERAGVAALPNPIGSLWMENGGYPGQRTTADLTRETSIYVTYPVESLFQRAPRVRRADEDVRTAEASLLQARRLIAAETVRAFFDVALAQVLQEEAEENRERVSRLVGYNRARVEAGVTAEGELLRLQVELDRGTNDVALAEVELTRSRARLAPYLGEAGLRAGVATIRVAVPSAAAFTPSALPALEPVLKAASERRPELLAGRARAGAATAAAEHERSLAVRQFGATFGNKRVGGLNTMVAGLSLSVPLFNLNGGGIRRATSEALAADHELAWAERRVAAGVHGAYGAAVRLTRQLGDLQQTFLTRAEQVHQLTVGAYEEGGATLLQVLDATSILADARLTYSRTLFAQRESLFDLALATGSEPSDALNLLREWSTASTANRMGDQP